MEQIQDYLSSSCTLGSQALTIDGRWCKYCKSIYQMIIIYIYIYIYTFLVVTCATGDVFANFVLAYFGIAFLKRHCLLKYTLAQHFSSLDLRFL